MTSSFMLHLSSSGYHSHVVLGVFKDDTLDIIFFLSKHNIHKSLSGLCFWASDPLIDRFWVNTINQRVWSPFTKATWTFMNVVIWQKSISNVDKFSASCAHFLLIILSFIRKLRTDFLRIFHARYFVWGIFFVTIKKNMI